MTQSIYYIDKSSNTFADNLATFGLAFVLDAITDGKATITLEDRGGAFVVVCESEITEKHIERCKFFAGAPFLITTKDGKRLVKGTLLTPKELPEPDGDTVVDYEMEKRDTNQFFEWLKTLSPEDKKAYMQGKELPDAMRPPSTPSPNWDIWRAINPAALQGYNALMAEWWHGNQQEEFAGILKILLQMTANTPNDMEGVEKAWGKLCKERGWKSKEATANQLLNPTQGKGVNSVKTEWSAPNNLRGFWMLEWLKMVGLFHGGITKMIRGTKDRKTYVLMPLRLQWKKHQEVMKGFKRAMASSSTAIKMDVLAALRYTEEFIKHYEGARSEGANLFGEAPSDLVSGMQMAFYKNLGQSPAVMNIATINLPRWVRPTSPESLAQMNEALEEHIKVASSFEESRGEQFELLSRYRDFLSGNDLEPFFEFTNAYSGFIISQRERGNRFVRQFTTTTLEVLFMNSDEKKFSEIVKNDGFKNIAYAIRHSTVVPQSRKKGKGGKPVVDVRYGLGQQLARKAAYPSEFLAEIGEFIHLYNAENAQLREKDRNPFRKNVTTADIDALTELVDQFGSKVICNMLVAYGYAREPFVGKDDETHEAEVDLPEAESDTDDGGEGEE